MATIALRFGLLFLLSLLVGTMFGIYAGFDPAPLLPRTTPGPEICS
jgi:hypothetical protein